MFWIVLVVHVLLGLGLIFLVLLHSGIILLLIDGLAVLSLSGRLGLSWGRGATAGAVVVVALALGAPQVMAQTVNTDTTADDQFATPW